MAVEFKRAQWFKPFMTHSRLKFISGGRGSGKTTHIAARLVEIAHKNRVNILVCREIERSIADSVYKAVKKAIERVGLSDAFYFLQKTIKSKVTGSEFSFVGLKQNPNKVLSMENLSFIWVEQAETLTDESIRLLTPTPRAPFAEIWFSWNPYFPSDPIETYCDRIRNQKTGKNGKLKFPFKYAHITYKDNPFFPPGLVMEREMCKELQPEIYDHVWDGSYLESGLGSLVLPYQELKECLGLDTKLKLGMSAPRWAYSGVDVADGGSNKPAYALRRSAKLLQAEEMIRAKDAIDIANHVVPLFNQQKIARCFYDGTGVGAAMKTEFRNASKHGKLLFDVEPFLFGGKPKGGDRYITPGVTNSEYFANLSAQAYWNLRVRLKRSLKLLNGEKINAEDCLILSRGIKDKVLRQLGQVVYVRKKERKVAVDKDALGPSPDIADAVVMAYSEDIRNGITLYG